MSSLPSAQFSVTLRLELERGPGVLGRVASVIGDAGGHIGVVDTIEMGERHAIREIVVDTSDREHTESVIAAVQGVLGARLVEVTDRTIELHRGGQPFPGVKTPIKTRDDLSMGYTPGGARGCPGIRAGPPTAFQETIKKNTAAA